MTGFQICLALWHCLPKEYSMADWKTTSGFSVNTRIFTLGRSIYLIGIFSFFAEYLCFVFALWHLPFFTDMTWFSFSNRSRRFPQKSELPIVAESFDFLSLGPPFVERLPCIKPCRFAHITFIWMSCLDLPHFFVALACMKTVKWWMRLTLIIFFSPSGQRRNINAQIWLELWIFVRYFVHKLLVLTKN